MGIAVVEWAGCYLVGTRSGDVPLAGCSEFPGGKCLPGESPRECVVRECREETGLDVEPCERLDCRLHAYPHGTVELHFWRCRVTSGPPDAFDAPPTPTRGNFHWVSAAALPALAFPEANAEVIALLRDRAQA